jgi:Got1/Sft2-like family
MFNSSLDEEGGSAFDYRNLLVPLSQAGSNNDLNNNNAPSSRWSLSWSNNNNNESIQEPPVCNMAFKDRLLCSGTCLVAAWLLNAGSWWKWHVQGNVAGLVLNTSMANLLQIAASLFWSHPKTQCQNMWAPQRKGATLTFIGLVATTICLAIMGSPSNLFLRLLWTWTLLILLPGQSIALTWYTLSYIPYAHETIKSFARSIYNRLVAQR